MVFPFNLFGSQPVVPERVSTDTVIPLSDRDDNRTNRSISLEFTMVFDEVLDAEKLSGALWKLFERPGWKKLGARLRLNDAGKLEYHVPAQYTQERPPINYTHVTEALPISEHPIGPHIPRANAKLQAFACTDHFRVHTGAKSITTVLEDWTNTDKAQLSLHIVNFFDATIVTITWLHTLLDAMGRSALLQAWQAVLEGRDDDVPEFIGYDTDPLAPLGTNVTEDYVLKDQLLGRLPMARFVFNFITELYMYPAEEARMVCMPASYFAHIKAQAFADLGSLADEHLTLHGVTGAPFLSDGDILTAWFTRLMARTNPSIAAGAPSRQILVMNVFGMRDLLRTSDPQLLPSDGAYIHNCAAAICSHFTVADFLSLPLGHVAARLRADLVRQSTRPQVEACQHTNTEYGGMALYGTGDMAMATMTNWHKAKLYDTDFSAAAVQRKNGNPKLKPSYIHAYSTTSKGFSVRGSGNCVGRDAEGNFWLGTVTRKDEVEAFARAVEEESLL